VIIVWMIKLIVIVQFLLSLEMFGVVVIWSRAWFHEILLDQVHCRKFWELWDWPKILKILL